MEAGSPYEKFYAETRRRVHQGDRRRRSRSIRSRTTIIRQQFVQDALSAGRRVRRLHRRPGLAARVRREGLHRRPDRQARREPTRPTSPAARSRRSPGTASVYALPIIVHNCAMYYRTDLLRGGRARRPRRRPGTSIATSPRSSPTRNRRLGHADRRQAEHRGIDPPARLHPAGRRRHPRCRQQADHRHRCRPRGAASS